MPTRRFNEHFNVHNVSMAGGTMCQCSRAPAVACGQWLTSDHVLFGFLFRLAPAGHMDVWKRHMTNANEIYRQIWAKFLLSSIKRKQPRILKFFAQPSIQFNNTIYLCFRCISSHIARLAVIISALKLTLSKTCVHPYWISSQSYRRALTSRPNIRLQQQQERNVFRSFFKGTIKATDFKFL